MVIRRVALDISFSNAGRNITRKRLLLLLRMPLPFKCYLRRGSRGWESFEQCSISFLRDYSADAICRHKTVYDYCTWLRQPESQSLIMCSGNFSPINGVLITFPIAVMVHVLVNCKVITGCFFIWILPKGLRDVKKMVCHLPCFVFLLQWVRSQGWIGCWKNNPCEIQTLSNCKELRCAPIKFRRNCYSTRVSLNCLESKWRNLMESSQYSNSSCCFLDRMSRSQSSSGKSRVRCLSNAFSSFGLIMSQWNAASDCRSSWSQWRTNLVSILEIAVERDPLPCDELARIIVHFLAVVGMVLFVYKYTGLEKTLIESPSTFLVLEWLATQAETVSWMPVFDCTKQSPLSLAFSCSESHSALVRWCSTVGICNSSTNRLFPLVIRTQDVRLGLFGDGIAISCPKLSRICTMWNFSDWSNNCSSRNCCTCSGTWVCSRNMIGIMAKPSSSSGLVL